ncbi:MAG: glycogen/starch synthase [bacterium]|nr:glycogen/starch synthase [bacterium]
MPQKKFRIANVLAEVSPYAKGGGLGDVGYALPKAIARLGHEVIVIMPYYGCVRKQDFSREKLAYQGIITIDGVEYPVQYRKHISPDGLLIYFVVNQELFGSHVKIYDVSEDESLRWIFFDLASIKLLEVINFAPDIIHAHEWHTGLIPNYLKTVLKDNPFFKHTAVLFTIHNLHYQGPRRSSVIPQDKTDKGTGAPPENKNYRNYINFAKRAIVFSDLINTVSERYAEEIITPQFGDGLEGHLKRRKDRLFGIINGIDYEIYNPSFDSNVYYKYDVKSLDKKLKNKLALQKEVGLEEKKDTPLIGVINRLTEMKGFDLILQAMPTLLKMNLQIVIVGSGERDDYLKLFREIARKHPNLVGVSSPFTQKMASKVYAGSDLYLLPSRFEPCGLSQLISLRYGSIPIVRAVGGLYDTITDYNPQTDTGIGFTFENYEKDELLVAIARACESYKYKECWNRLVYRAMKQSFSWELPARKYVQLYEIALKLKKKNPS